MNTAKIHNSMLKRAALTPGIKKHVLGVLRDVTTGDSAKLLHSERVPTSFIERLRGSLNYPDSAFEEARRSAILGHKPDMLIQLKTPAGFITEKAYRDANILEKLRHAFSGGYVKMQANPKELKRFARLDWRASYPDGMRDFYKKWLKDEMQETWHDVQRSNTDTRSAFKHLIPHATQEGRDMARLGLPRNKIKEVLWDKFNKLNEVEQ